MTFFYSIPRSDLIGIVSLLLSIVFLIIDLLYFRKHDDFKPLITFGLILFLISAIASNFIVKYEIRDYIERDYKLYLSYGLFEPMYKEVDYEDYWASMNSYSYSIDAEKKIIYMYKKIK